MFQAEDGIRYLVRSRGRGDVYKRQALDDRQAAHILAEHDAGGLLDGAVRRRRVDGVLHDLPDLELGQQPVNLIDAQRLSLIHI